ncbi:MAG: hypothetical protein AAF591_03165 [Verrucomicrobiota bacterium]
MSKNSWLAWPALIFGSLGVALSLAAVAAAFILSARIQSSVDTVFTRVDTMLETVHDTSTEVSDSITDSREYLANVNQRIEEKVVNLSSAANIDPAQFESITLSLLTVSQRVQSWLTLFESAKQLTQLIEELIDATLIFFRTDNQTREDLLAALDQGHAQLQETLTAFDELIIQWEVVRTNPNSPAQFQPLFSRIDTALENVEQYTANFTQGVSDLQSATDALQSRLKKRLAFATLIITLLLIWNTAAQFTLTLWGWQNRAPTPGTPPQT